MERRGKREWSTSEGKGEVDRERERSGMGGSCESKLMEEGSELLDVDRSCRCRGAGVRSRWCLDEQSTHCRVEGMRTAIWPVRSWVRWRDLSLSLSICASVSPFFSPSFSLCAFLEMVWSENNNGKYFTPRCLYFTVNTENIFSLTQFSVTTKHPLLRKNISRSGLKPKQTHP